MDHIPAELELFMPLRDNARTKPAHVLPFLLVPFLTLIGSSTAPTFAQSCVAPPSGIIAWWPFDETSGTIAADIAGTKPAAYFGTPASAPGMVGGSLRFNGTTHFVAAGDSDLWAFGTGNFTIEFWANFDAPGSGDIVHAGDIFIGNDNGPGNINKWFFALGGGVLHFTVWNTQSPPPNIYLVRAPFSPVVGQWYHLAVTKTGQLFTIYVNGVPIGSELSPAPISNPSAPLTIGQAETLGFMNGRLDEMTVYNRSLAPAELQGIFQAGSAGKCKVLPASTRVSPATGGDTGSVSVSIAGTGLAPGVAVKLVRAGNPDIPGANLQISNDGKSLGATFDLTGKASGAWDLVITNLNSPPTTLPQAFTIEPGKKADVWVDIVGRGAIRVGQATQFNVLYGNRGNVNATGAFLWISGIPPTATVKPNFIFVPFPRATPRPAPVNTGSEILVPLLINTIPPGFTGVLNLEITVPFNTGSFHLKTLVMKP